MACRICLEQGGERYCKCSGTSAHAHEACLLKWISVSKRDECEICKHPFEFETSCEFSPTCRPTLKDISVSDSFPASVITFGFALLISGTVFLTNTIAPNYIITTVAQNIIFVVYTCLGAEVLHVATTLLLLESFASISICSLVFTPHVSNDMIRVCEGQCYATLGTFVMWLLHMPIKHSIRQSRTIMVYSQDECAPKDVDPSVPAHQSAKEQRARTPEKTETNESEGSNVLDERV